MFILFSLFGLGYHFRVTCVAVDIDHEEKKREHRLGRHEVPYAVNPLRVAEFATHHMVWNRVYILRVRSEIGYGKSYILVWNRVKVFRTGRHTPPSLPPPPPPPTPVRRWQCRQILFLPQIPELHSNIYLTYLSRSIWMRVIPTTPLPTIPTSFKEWT